MREEAMEMTIQEDDPRTAERRAVLLSASFARWQAQKHPYPIVAPFGAKGALPMSLGRTKRVLDHAWEQDDDGKHTVRCVDRMLRSCNHEQRSTIVPRASDPPEDRGGDHWVTPEAVLPGAKPDSWVDTTIDFQSGSLITTVFAYSAFANVSQEKAEEFMKQAEPARWSERSDFFRLSVPGRWDPAANEFTRGPISNKYQLFEQAEWNWSPEFTGATVNILEIEKKSYISPQDLAVTALSKLGAEPPSSKITARWRAFLNEHYDAAPEDLQIQFTYGLFRSLRMRLLASWLPGGLSHDDGDFAAAWFPMKRDLSRGLLCIAADKKLCFSRQADAVQDYSRFLNLMAPALSSLLMEQLIHDSIVKFLLGEAGQPPGSSDLPPQLASEGPPVATPPKQQEQRT